MSINIPDLGPGENYSIFVLDSSNNLYLDSLGEYHNWYKTPLTKIGTWNITFDWNIPTSVQWYDYIESSFLKEFNVLSRYDIDIRNNSIVSLYAQWIGIFFAIIIPIGILIFQIRRESSRLKRNQLGYLKDIILRVNKILDDLEGFKEEIIKRRNRYCPYDIKYINSDYYEFFLDSEIDGKSTMGVKAKLIWIDDKIKLINKYNMSHNPSAVEAALEIIDKELMGELIMLKKNLNKRWLSSNKHIKEKEKETIGIIKKRLILACVSAFLAIVGGMVSHLINKIYENPADNSTWIYVGIIWLMFTFFIFILLQAFRYPREDFEDKI